MDSYGGDIHFDADENWTRNDNITNGGKISSISLSPPAWNWKIDIFSNCLANRQLITLLSHVLIEDRGSNPFIAQTLQ